jgi:hypothetical protein
MLTLEDGTEKVVPKCWYRITTLHCVISQNSADLKYKLISVFTIAGNVSRIVMSGGGNKVSKFMIPTQLRKVNCREIS